MRKWHGLAWLLLAEMGAIACLGLFESADFIVEFRAEAWWMYGRPATVLAGIPLLWPSFRLLTERRSPVVALLLATLGGVIWIAFGISFYPLGGQSGTRLLAVWQLNCAVPLVNAAVLLLLVLARIGRAVLRAAT